MPEIKKELSSTQSPLLKKLYNDLDELNDITELIEDQKEKLKGAIERVYTLYSNLSLSLCEQYSYNMNNYLAR